MTGEKTRFERYVEERMREHKERIRLREMKTARKEAGIRRLPADPGVVPVASRTDPDPDADADRDPDAPDADGSCDPCRPRPRFVDLRRAPGRRALNLQWRDDHSPPGRNDPRRRRRGSRLYDRDASGRDL